VETLTPPVWKEDVLVFAMNSSPFWLLFLIKQFWWESAATQKFIHQT